MQYRYPNYSYRRSLYGRRRIVGFHHGFGGFGLGTLGLALGLNYILGYPGYYPWYY